MNIYGNYFNSYNPYSAPIVYTEYYDYTDRDFDDPWYPYSPVMPLTYEYGLQSYGQDVCVSPCRNYTRPVCSYPVEPYCAAPLPKFKRSYCKPRAIYLPTIYRRYRCRPRPPEIISEYIEYLPPKRRCYNQVRKVCTSYPRPIRHHRYIEPSCRYDRDYYDYYDYY
jgi:hypothetical protein